ncbi:hypothetical protein ACNFG0_17185 [Pseudomonas sp. NY15372]|uniref:hypothetical protein n=1 Tax=Pseudomonas sp. NY15372 TaxID=3400356 RepID=UPI003A86B368
MQLLISDANILIDLEEGELLDELFRLPYQFTVPDILFFEELEAQHGHLLRRGLSLGELSQVITLDQAREAYERMRANARRLPWAMAYQRLDDLFP